jgi:uncharacterized protein YjbI with pentapeptide repeats
MDRYKKYTKDFWAENLENTKYYNQDLNNTNFSDCNLKFGNFSNCDLSCVYFDSSCNFSNADFNKAKVNITMRQKLGFGKIQNFDKIVWSV